MTPCSMAEYRSDKGRDTTETPSFFSRSAIMALLALILRPLRSSSVRTGFLVVAMLREPQACVNSSFTPSSSSRTWGNCSYMPLTSAVPSPRKNDGEEMDSMPSWKGNWPELAS